MNLSRIQSFLAVADEGTVTAAAARLRMAQPALSRQIKALERDLRVRLFEPSGSRIVLTAAGRALIPAARALAEEARGFAQAAERVRTGRVDRLVVAATGASVRSFLGSFIAGTTREDPQLVVRETSHFGMAESLRRGCDLAVTPHAPEPGLRRLALGSVPVRATVSAAHPWARSGVRALPLQAFDGVPAILPSHSSVSRHLLDAAMSRAGLAFGSVTECDDGLSVLALSVAGHGAGFTTEDPAYGAHAVDVLDDDTPEARPLALPLHAVWLPGHFAEDTLESLALRLREHLSARRRFHAQRA